MVAPPPVPSSTSPPSNSRVWYHYPYIVSEHNASPPLATLKLPHGHPDERYPKNPLIRTRPSFTAALPHSGRGIALLNKTSGVGARSQSGIDTDEALIRQRRIQQYIATNRNHHCTWRSPTVASPHRATLALLSEMPTLRSHIHHCCIIITAASCVRSRRPRDDADTALLPKVWRTTRIWVSRL